MFPRRRPTWPITFNLELIIQTAERLAALASSFAHAWLRILEEEEEEEEEVISFGVWLPNRKCGRNA
jgi:hypothetical protein